MALLWHGKRHWQQWEVLGRNGSQVRGTYLIWKKERGWNTKLKTEDWFLKSLFGFQFFMRITQTLVSCLLFCLIIDGSGYHIHLIFSKFILAREGKTPWICPEDMHCFQNASSRQDCRQKKGGQAGLGLNAELLLGTDLQCRERCSSTKPALGLRSLELLPGRET